MTSFQRIWRLLDSNYGRNHGWFIELDGRIVGELVNSGFAEMFWDEYDVVVYEGAGDTLGDDDNWLQCRFKYRNQYFNEYAEHAFPWGVQPVIRDGHVQMRALYLLPVGRAEKFWMFLLEDYFDFVSWWRKRRQADGSGVVSAKPG